MEVSLNQLPVLAQKIAGHLNGGDVLLLSGPLGSGKTTLTQAVVRALGYEGRVSSPTFVLERRYPILDHPTVKEVLHLDFYRLQPEQVTSFDWHEEAGQSGLLTIIEWPEVASDQIKTNEIKQIKIEIIDEQTRHFTLSNNLTD